MQIPKPTATDIERFRSLVPDDAEVKPLFGNLGAFLHGNMFMGLLGADIGLKYGEAAGTTRLMALIAISAPVLANTSTMPSSRGVSGCAGIERLRGGTRP